MAFWSKWFRPSAAAEADARASSLANPEAWLLEALGAAPTAAGVPMSPVLAVALPDVFACLQVTAQDFARTPCTLQAVAENGTRTAATGRRLHEILHDLPNPETTSFDFRYELVWDLLQHERAYAEVIRTPSGEVAALWRLDPERMEVDRAPNGRKRWTLRRDVGEPLVWLFDADKPPVFEVRARSPIRRVREALGHLAALEKHNSKFFANGTRLSGLFGLKGLPAGPAGLQAFTDFEKKVQAIYAGPENAYKALVSSGDVEFKQFTTENDKAQFLETRKFLRTVICGLFRMPPHKIGDLERATFSNIEHQGIAWVTDGLGWLYETWTQSTRRDLLTTRQYPRYDVFFDRTALVQSDLRTLVDALSRAVQSGLMTLDEGRARLGLNGFGGPLGSTPLFNGSMLTADQLLAGRAALGPAAAVPADAAASGDGLVM